LGEDGFTYLFMFRDYCFGGVVGDHFINLINSSLVRPLCLKILNRVLEKKNANNPITQEEFRELLEKLYSIIIKTNEVGEWAENANKLLNEYEAGEE